jgi:hypothetical protein
MLLPTKRVLPEYHALVLKMHRDVDTITQVAHNLKLLCDLEVVLALSCIMPMLEGLNELMKFSQSQKCFVCDFVVVMKLCQTNLYYQYNDPHNAYLSDAFHRYRNLLNETSNVVVHEWAPNLKMGLENLSFQIVGISIMMHSLLLPRNNIESSNSWKLIIKF